MVLCQDVLLHKNFSNILQNCTKIVLNCTKLHQSDSKFTEITIITKLQNYYKIITKLLQNYYKIVTRLQSINYENCSYNYMHFFRRNLLLCLHLETNSVLLLSRLLEVSVMISSFSVRHREHSFAPPRYGGAFFLIFHVTLKSSLLSLRAQTFFESSVLLLLSSCLNELVWPPYLSLNVFPAIPRYVKTSLPVLRVAS